ncbi:protein phosphatase CheZ [Silvimonas amylolytica]|uniref:Protein phosphatase CheZ n=1 Tax=Silvimonas amylolytica TaxID=449663 RepID=A0ABQ2PKQ9_9NEIS|nr:protein phosphatase CheZ [Silvimonas amylolytica]GGP26209.1 protein phosphatase CheZ [Silvimonas amylolytica]
MSDQALNSSDSPDLEALFDSIVSANRAAEAAEDAAPAAAPVAAAVNADAGTQAAADMSEPARTMFTQIGQLTRHLHDTLRELGLDKSLEKAAHQIPDARDRLSYIATMTEQAAERTLNALDDAKPLQDEISGTARQLSNRWNQLFAHELTVEEFKQLVYATRAHLEQTTANSEKISSQMLEIMMAQDFQDLTGQVIKKVLGMVKEMESQLLEFLVTFSPQQGGSIAREDGLLAGPVISSDGRTDVVTDQAQVDDLLESLGF